MSNVAAAELDAAQNAILAAGTTYWLSLHTAAPGETGAAEGTDGRQSITFAASSGGSQASNDAQTWASAKGGQTYTDFGIWNMNGGVSLSTALVSGTAYTTLAVTAIPAALASGATVTLISGANTQTYTLSAAAAAAATSLAVTSLAANYSYPVGSVVQVGSYLRGGPLSASITPPAGSEITFASGAVTLTAS
jgi:hypothetical protein